MAVYSTLQIDMIWYDAGAMVDKHHGTNESPRLSHSSYFALPKTIQIKLCHAIIP